MIIAIDGPAGAGKGTLARNLAGAYKMKYLDTGLLYRAVALLVARNGGDPAHEEDAVTAAKALMTRKFDYRHVGNDQFSAFLDGEDVLRELRQLEMGRGASKASFFPSVRAALKDFQIEFAKEWGAKIGVILDGRDIGTVICPDADIKFFLEATPEERARRRVEELESRNLPANYQEALAEILERDARDRGRTTAPLKAAADALILDTSNMNAAEVLAFAKEKIDACRSRSASA